MSSGRGIQVMKPRTGECSKIMIFSLTFRAVGRILLIDDSPALSGLGSLYGCLFFSLVLHGGFCEAAQHCLR